MNSQSVSYTSLSGSCGHLAGFSFGLIGVSSPFYPSSSVFTTSEPLSGSGGKFVSSLPNTSGFPAKPSIFFSSCSWRPLTKLTVRSCVRCGLAGTLSCDFGRARSDAFAGLILGLLLAASLCSSLL